MLFFLIIFKQYGQNILDQTLTKKKILLISCRKTPEKEEKGRKRTERQRKEEKEEGKKRREQAEKEKEEERKRGRKKKRHLLDKKNAGKDRGGSEGAFLQ